MPDITDMLINFSRSIEPIYLMVTGLAYVMGIMFAFRALYYLKVYGEARTMMATQSSMKEPLVFLFVASILIYLPTGFSMVMMTTFGYDNVLSYNQLAPINVSVVGIAVIRLVQLIGVIAFVRGWLLLAKAATQGGSQQGYGMGLTHVLGGIAAMNIVGTVNIFAATFGFS